MNDEEIKQLLRELSASADGSGKSRTVRISLDPKRNEEPPASEKQPDTAEREPEGKAEPEGSGEKAAGRGLAGIRERMRRNSERREEIIRQGDPEDSEEAEQEEEETTVSAGAAVGSLMAGLGERTKNFAARMREAQEERAARKAAEAERKAAQEAETAEFDEAEDDDFPDFPEAAETEEDAAAPVISADIEDDEATADKSEMESAEIVNREEQAAEEEAGSEEPAEEADVEPEQSGTEAEVSAQKPSVTDEDLSSKRRQRKAPVEPADFESDAHLFRSAPREEADSKEDEERGSLKDRIQAYLTMLDGRGIGRTQRIMILIGAVLLILAVVIGMSIVSAKRKSAHVTADEGLTVTVEKEPGSWTTSAEVTLGIQTSSPIQSITVNGENYEFTGSTRTKIQVDADTEQLEIMVVSQQNVLNAVADITKLDTTAPVVNLSSSAGIMTIDAVDERSGVQAVYYGKLIGLSEIPEYTLYTEPFIPDEEALYVYYAVDHAGNMAGPVTTTMSPAQELSISTASMTLFPGDTETLKVGTVPEGAFLNNLTIVSENPEIASVDGNGVVTARADGETDLLITADGLPEAVCHVTVRSSAQVTISAIGDVTLGDDINFSPLNSFSTVASMNGSSYFFANVRDILGQDDLTYANFEGTLTTQGSRVDKTYAFRGDPSYTQILTEGSVEAVTLANNHSSDYGEISQTDTQQYLTEAGITWVNGAQTAVVEAGGVQVGLVGIYCIDNESSSAVSTELKEAIDTVRKDGAQVTVVAFHWGQEKAEVPSDAQQTLAHRAIDSGADLVVGHHPHVLQGIEIYEGKYIVYSLGNFCFGGNSSPSDMDTMIFQATFHLSRAGSVDGTEVEVIPCSISSDSSWNNYQPTPASGDEAQRILSKINERSAVFGENAYTAG